MPRVRSMTVRWILRAVLALIALGLIVAATVLIWEWTYLSRALTYPKNPVTNVDWHQPKEKIAGREGRKLPTARAEETEIAPDALAKAADYCEQKFSAAFLVVHRDKIVAERYWGGCNQRSWTTSMSMAKTVVALLIGIALEEKRIQSVDESAATYLPEWSDEARKKITIKHLLQMSSGLRDAGEYDDLFSDQSYLALGTDSPYVVINAAADKEPGTEFHYNNINAAALGLILERATGRRYAEYLSERLWKPLGASDAAIWLDRRGGMAKAFGGIFATPEDWARIGLLILHEGKADGKQIVPRDWIRQMITSSPSEVDYGYQVWLGNGGIRSEDRDEPFLAKDIIYLDGKYKQRVYIIPSENLVIVRLGEQARRWDDAYLPNAILRGLRREKP
jgi:CubicO group peptidase (beta-lactamase class C family)